MKHTIKFIIVLFSLVVTGATSVWGITEDDIIVNVLPNSSAGTVTVAVSGMNVTITATPATDYFIDASHIIAEKMVDPSVSHHAPGLSSSLPISGSNPFTFTIPDGYTGAYVTVNFYKKSEGFTPITSLSEITDMNGKYQLTADVSGVSSSLEEFKGTLDGGLHKIIGSSAPLFASTDGAIIRNIIFEDVNISSGDGDGDAGAVTSKAKGATRIYNCGILPTSVERDDKGNITGFYGSSVSGTGNVGGLVGTLSGTARVINCFSYANITGGTNKGGIVGSNEETSTQASFTTMVMNCLFYGEISNGGNVSPIYGGTEINNVEGGLNNYNYYRYNSSYSKNKQINKYNRALAMEEKFINRFERYRLLLNSNKKLAAKYASTATVTVEPGDMAKWVLETADRSISGRDPYPYPVLKAQGYYPSIINPDIEHAPDNASVGRNHGGKLGKTLIVHIAGVGSGAPTGAKILRRGPITLQRTDKDFDRFNFNYDKVQLPYYNDYGTKNYTGYRVVTGWKITSITGGTAGTFNEADEWGGYNFADRKCTNKDLYSVSKRVFSQGAYWDVPEGVTAITIEPNWAVANYVSDEYYDVVYDASYNKKSYTMNGKQYTSGKIVVDGSEQTVYTNISSALAGFSTEGKRVYDQAVVLVGNVHQYANPTNTNKPYTVMSIDMDHDNEPDYSYIFTHDNRRPIDPIRYDFLNIMGMAEAQIPNGATLLRNVSIFNLKGWFEITNTCLVNFSQFEIENSKDSQNAATKSPAPLILLGGTYEQIASTQKTPKPASTKYIHIGSNAWFAKFGNGTHSDGSGFTPHIPVSVTGGDYDEFYLSGTYQPDITNMASDDAECYISGGRFGEMAGASMEAIWGDVRWDINWADITNFYGGGVNAVNPITGKIQVDITNSYVNQYCGGPKFGDMVAGKTVTTNATDCVFGTYFGAGYGGNAYKRLKYKDVQNSLPADYQNDYRDERGKYYDGATSSTSYGKKGKGVATDFDYEFFVWSTGGTGSRFYIKFISFSLAKTNDVKSTLTKCTVNNNFYGGGSLGKVLGTATSVLDDCTVNGNVFGAGYSATIPKIEVRNTPAFKSGKEPSKNINIGMFEEGEIADAVIYEWKHVDNLPNNGASGMESTSAGNFVYTDEDLTTLGQVKNSNLIIKGATTVSGDVYGGGALASMDAIGQTKVTLLGGTINGDVYGGGQGRLAGTKDEKGIDLPEVKAMVGSTKVNLNGLETGDYVAAEHSALVEAYPEEATGENIQYYTLKSKDSNNKAIKGCVVKGNIFGCNNLNGTPKGSVTVNVYKTEGYDGHQRTGYNAETATAREAALDDIDDTHHSYEVKAVYGGGNLAAYEPDDANNKKTQVNIYGCGDTSIQQVYGGGNAASTPATQVHVYGTYEIEEVFGGGNGKDDISHDGGKTYIKNPGANVGFKDYWDYEKEKDMEDYDTKEKRQDASFIANYVYGSGEAHVNIHGGRTHRVYGGSNTKGNVKAVAVTMLEDVSGCDFKVDEAYGGGKSAEMDGASRLEMACIPGLKNAYGGAEAADIASDVTLNITNGNFNRVFGGNNVSGTIHGRITVNIEETGCHLITIGQLYGGGNQAAYTGPEILDDKDEGTGVFQGPTLNVRSFTSIGEIYGGGYGKTATVKGDTYVNINVCDGKNFGDDQATEVARANEHTGDQQISFSEYKRTDDGGFVTDDDGNRIVDSQNIHVYLPPYESGIGNIGNVYGGGNAAKVDGSTHVNIGTIDGDIIFETPTADAEAARKHTIKGANIVGNVYGGGNAAEVTGNTNVTIGKETTTTVSPAPASNDAPTSEPIFEP